MSLRLVGYTDEHGRRWLTRIPEHVPDSEAPAGIPVGPQPLDSLNLPDELHTRLHNALVDREILTAADAMRNPEAIRSAIMAALRLDVTRVQDVFSAPGGRT